MLYRFIKLLAITAIKTFFNSISSEHADTIPKNKPLIFTSNHPNTMMDPIVIGYTCCRNLHFFAKSTLFSTSFTNWFLQKIHLVPLFRRQDNPKQMHKNKESFSKAFDLLKENKAFLIFPEGVSTGERILSKIKTGAARIGFGAELHGNWELDVHIIPVGINYSNSIQFRSDALVRFGQPIRLSDFKALYKEDEIEAVHQVTSQIETALSKLTVNLKDLETQHIVEALETIYKQELAVDLGMEINDKKDDFSVTKGLITAVEWYYDYHPEQVEIFKGLLHKYERLLSRLNLKDEFLDPSTPGVLLSSQIKALSYLFFLFPVYLYGVINNVIPYKFPRWYTSHFVRAKAEIASWKMITGTAVFLIYYPIEIMAVWFFSGSFFWAFVYALTLPMSGNFVLKYLRRIQDYRQQLRFLSIFSKKRRLIYLLIQQRTQLIGFINKAKDDYLESIGFSSEALNKKVVK